MKKFNNVIVKRPCKAVCNGITSSPELGQPIYEKALQQHNAYIEALKNCGVEVTILEPDERYPDSCFVEDPALITKSCAIITNPGAESRNGEKDEIIGAIRKFFPEEKIEYIKSPGTLERGDVMMVDDTFYVGLSARTNEEGIRQLGEIADTIRLNPLVNNLLCFLYRHLALIIWRIKMKMQMRIMSIYCLLSRSYSFQWKAL